jgi:integrase
VTVPAAAARSASSDDQWDWLRRDEVSKLLAAPKLRPQARAIFEVAAFTGLRAGELWALRWEEVELERGVIRVERALGADGKIGPPKSGRSREVPILHCVRRALEDQLTRTGTRSLVFVSRAGAGFSTGYDADIGKALARAKVERRVSFHDLRHTFASLAVQGELERDGLPAMRLEDLRQWLGHATSKPPNATHTSRRTGCGVSSSSRPLLVTTTEDLALVAPQAAPRPS